MPGAPDPRPTPSASGTLASRPLVHLLVYARNRRLTGTLELHAADGSGGTIELWRGRISGARTTPPIAYFGTVAYELGCIDTVVLDATLLHISRTKRLHGEVLVERGAITAAQRDVILAEQACRKIHHLFSLPEEATFAFYDARPDVQEPPLALDAIKPAWRGLRDHIPAESVREVLERYAAIALRLSSEGPGARGAFNAEESALCDALASRAMTLAEMRAASALPAHRVDLLAYLLVITKSVEPATASAPTAPAGDPEKPRRPAAATSEPATTGARRAHPDSGEVRVSLSFRVPSRARAVDPERPVLVAEGRGGDRAGSGSCRSRRARRCAAGAVRRPRGFLRDARLA